MSDLHDRGDLSGVPRDFLPAPGRSVDDSRIAASAPFANMLRYAAWACIALGAMFALWFLADLAPARWPAGTSEVAPAPVAVPSPDAEAEQQALEAQRSYADAMRDMAQISEHAKAQQAAAMKAAAAARAMAANPDSPEAKQAIADAMREVQALSEAGAEASRVDRPEGNRPD